MSTDLPPPLVEADVNLRGMEFMPLFGDRLFKSTTWIEASNEARVAALQLWWHAFGHEQPAASLPDSERLLAEYAGLGGSLRIWRRVRDMAMRGWIKCSDGRWYHAMVAELAKEAWAGRVRNREKVRKFREKRGESRIDEPPSVTVTETVTTPLGNRRESEGQAQAQTKSPPEGSAHAPDAATVIFTTGKEWLKRATGKSDRECRALLGKWRRDYDDAALIEALGAAQREGAIDGVGFIARALQQARGNSGPQRFTNAQRQAAFIAGLRRASDATSANDELEIVGHASLADDDEETT